MAVSDSEFARCSAKRNAWMAIEFRIHDAEPDAGCIISIVKAGKGFECDAESYRFRISTQKLIDQAPMLYEIGAACFSDMAIKTIADYENLDALDGSMYQVAVRNENGNRGEFVMVNPDIEPYLSIEFTLRRIVRATEM